jgi:hypothetical protein
MIMNTEQKYKNEKEIAEMTLLLMSLTSWREKVRDEWSAPKAWKGYDFDILNNLAEQGFIHTSHRAKSVILTEKGLKEVERLKKKYLK